MSITTTSSRRQFIFHAAAVCGVGAAGPQAFAQAPKQVDEADEQAVALGYRHDTHKVDTKKYPKHTPAQHCANCSFWQGKPEDAWAGCAMFGRKQVARNGWCQVWAKVPG